MGVVAGRHGGTGGEVGARIEPYDRDSPAVQLVQHQIRGDVTERGHGEDR
ncbi:hypothetical protein [Streptomyces halobius]|nr:hypothetical protein [Streptomyces halobius]